MGTQSAMRGDPGVAGRAVELRRPGGSGGSSRRARARARRCRRPGSSSEARSRAVDIAKLSRERLAVNGCYPAPRGAHRPLTPRRPHRAPRRPSACAAALRDAARLRLRGRPVLAPAREPSRDPRRVLGVPAAGGRGGDHVRRRPHRHRPGLGVDGDAAGPRRPAVDSWSNPDYVFDPVVGIQLVLRRRGPRGGEPVRGRARWPTPRCCAPTTTACTPATATRRRSRSCSSCTRPCCAGWSASSSPTSRRARRVLDAGCGRSLFTEIRPRLALHHRGRRRRPRPAARRARRSSRRCGGWWRRRTRCPSATGAFDALFAGELIEHLADPARGRGRVPPRPAAGRDADPHHAQPPAPGQPRRIGSERPYSPDHLSELSYDEARALLRRARASRSWQSTGLHLELLLNWLSPHAQARPAAARAGTGRGRCR